MHRTCKFIPSFQQRFADRQKDIKIVKPHTQGEKLRVKIIIEIRNMTN